MDAILALYVPPKICKATTVNILTLGLSSTRLSTRRSLIIPRIKIFGIDTPLIDPADAKDLLTHQSVYKHNLAILEGLVLSDVPDGVYHLIALPLRIKDADAAPVRAILLEE